jgi:hypothetical protein
MKITPILFSSEMIHALLNGRKTQTRRIVAAKHVPFIENITQQFFDGKWDDRPFPYGKPGDLLYVRETIHNRPEHGNFYYAADNTGVGEYVFNSLIEMRRERKGRSKKSINSIHMPRFASRLTLELTDVRVERLQDITTGDAWAEGCPNSDIGAIRDWFKPLWESINGAGSWKANPWVWVLGFKVHKTNINQFTKKVVA